MDDMVISASIVDAVIKSSYNAGYEPDENQPILNISPEFMQALLNTQGISDLTKRYLLSKKDRLRVKSKALYAIKVADDNMDVSEWFPRMTYSAFQARDTECSFFIYDPKKDMRMGARGYDSWISRSNKKIDMTAIVPSNFCLNISKTQWGLAFDGLTTQYELDGVGIRHTKGVCICLTFYTTRKLTEGFLLYERGQESGNTRGLSITSEGLKNWGVNNNDNFKFIKMNALRKSVTVFIDYPGNNENRMGRFYINRTQKGEFEVLKDSGVFTHNCFVGAKQSDNTANYFSGAIVSMDIFYHEKPTHVPTHLVNLLLNKHITHAV